MAAALSDTDIQTELWRSFISVLKSYAAAASLNGIEHHVPALDEEDFEIHAAGRKLSLAYHVHTQHGHWFVSGNDAERHGVFQLTHHGTAVVDGSELDLDHAAIEIIAKLTNGAGASL
jgi:hypothetical protein